MMICVFRYLTIMHKSEFGCIHPNEVMEIFYEFGCQFKPIIPISMTNIETIFSIVMGSLKKKNPMMVVATIPSEAQIG